MNKEETEKFDKILSDGYNELVNIRPPKPIEHFIYYLINSVPMHIVERDKNLLNFYEEYKAEFEKSKELPEKHWSIYIYIYKFVIFEKLFCSITKMNKAIKLINI